MYQYKTIPLSQISKKSPYYETLKKADKLEKLKWH